MKKTLTIFFLLFQKLEAILKFKIGLKIAKPENIKPESFILKLMCKLLLKSRFSKNLTVLGSFLNSNGIILL